MCGILCLIRFGSPLDRKECDQNVDKLKPRGPDDRCVNYFTETIHGEGIIEVMMGFRRLSIMDLSSKGMQPFHSTGSEFYPRHVICNGEIYNWRELSDKFSIEMKSDCDCEIILPLQKQMGFSNMIERLDGEFAMVFYDSWSKTLKAVRDRYGVRPLFYGYNTKTKTIGFASEMKALHSMMEFVSPVKPNQVISIDFEVKTTDLKSKLRFDNYYSYSELTPEVSHGVSIETNPLERIHEKIRELMTRAVAKRLDADRAVGFLLSGGLDSSLIVAIATKIFGPDNMHCFSIGLDGSPDVVAAKKVAEALGIVNHHCIEFDVKEGIDAIPDVIRMIESYDITTIRASTPQYLMAKYIKEKTNVRVLLSGEGSDEIHGSYKYFRQAPSSEEFHEEAIRLTEELYMYDNLRTDRTMAGHGLEVRVPFLDFDYVKYVMDLDPELFMYKEGKQIEKQLIRDAFKGYLPDEILYRPKEAFSDAVSSDKVNWYRSISTLAEKMFDSQALKKSPYLINKPETPESLYYRNIFSQFYPSRCNVIAHYWLPKFQRRHITDPSATIL